MKMGLLKLSGVFVGLGIFFYGLAYISAGQLVESKSHRFPESLGRHYAKATGQMPGSDSAIEFRQSLDLANTADLKNIDTIEIETTAVDIKLLPASSEAPSAVGIELRSRKVNSQDPLLTDTSSTRTLRITTNEGDRDTTQERSRPWMNLSFGDFEEDDSRPHLHSGLVLRIPVQIKNVVLRSVSGDADVETSIETLKFQTKSGDLELKNSAVTPAVFRDVFFETVSGDFSSEASFQKLVFNSVSGDINLSTLNPESVIDGKSVSGDLKIDLESLPTKQLDAKIDFNSKSGHIDFEEDALTALGLSRVPPKNQTFNIGKGSSQISFNTVSGNLEIE